MAHESLHELTAAYALDALDERDLETYEEHLSGCPDCREELASLSGAASALAYAVAAPPPPPGLRDRILEAATAEPTNVVPLLRRPAFQAAAGVAAVAACLAIAFGLWSSSLHNQVDRYRNRSSSLAAAMSIVANPHSQRRPLTGGSGTLVVDPQGQAALVVEDLPAAPSGRTYEAWVMGTGAPQPAGLFRGGGMTVFPLDRTLARGNFVGVTVERESGVQTPTGAPILRSPA
ncbi:MAG: anti-sigma factor domain-containing protein [Gaiellaceae bacterium]